MVVAQARRSLGKEGPSPMHLAFKGGIHPDSHKEMTAQKTIELMAQPRRVTLPMSMHAGPPATPRVAVGDRVCLGEKIADSSDHTAVPVHATVSGTVREIAPKPHPFGGQVLSVAIDNDEQDEMAPGIRPIDSDVMKPAAIIEEIREAGLVGHGGAAFPTHLKLENALGRVDTVLINAAESEPYITSDHRIMLEYPWELMGGIKLLRRILDVRQVHIGIESDKKDTLPILREYQPPDESVKIVRLPTKYPQGAEKQLIRAVLGRRVPPGKLPADVGVIVLNVDTVCAIYRLFVTGMPVVRRIVTVSGSAISNPKNLEVRIGTPVEDLIAACGGAVQAPQRLLMGGPMMGVALSTTEVPVIKATSGIVAFCKGESAGAKSPHCIRCGKCVDACPMGLMPLYLDAAARKGSMHQLERYHLNTCTECGACAYVCPGKMPLVEGIRAGKIRVQAAAHIEPSTSEE